MARILRRLMSTATAGLPGHRVCVPSRTNCGECAKFPCGNIMRRQFEARQPFYSKPVFWVAAAAAGYVLSNIEVIPLSGRLRLRLVPGVVDDYFARKYDGELLQALGPRFLPTDSAEHRRVEAVGRRLTAACNLDCLTYHVVDDPNEQNAFVSAGGHVLVYTGLLTSLPEDDELAVILGHEIGHYIAHHVAERIGMDWISLALKNVLSDSKPVRYLSALMVVLPRSRLIETEADYMGLLLMAAACYDLQAASRVWARLHSMSDMHPPAQAAPTGTAALIADTQDAEARGSLYDKYMSTHPTYTERLRHFQEGSVWMSKAQELRAARCGCGCSEAPVGSPSTESLGLMTSSAAAPAVPPAPLSPSLARTGDGAAARCAQAATGNESAGSGGKRVGSGDGEQRQGAVSMGAAGGGGGSVYLCMDSRPLMWWEYCYRRLFS